MFIGFKKTKKNKIESVDSNNISNDTQTFKSTINNKANIISCLDDDV